MFFSKILVGKFFSNPHWGKICKFKFERFSFNLIWKYPLGIFSVELNRKAINFQFTYFAVFKPFEAFLTKKCLKDLLVCLITPFFSCDSSSICDPVIAASSKLCSFCDNEFDPKAPHHFFLATIGPILMRFNSIVIQPQWNLKVVTISPYVPPKFNFGTF